MSEVSPSAVARQGIALFDELVKRSVTLETIFHYRGLIENAYLELGSAVHDGHAWKEEKIVHASISSAEGRKSAGLLGVHEITGEFIAFLLFAHDVGRLREAKRNINKLPHPHLHGTDSKNVLIEWLRLPYGEDYDFITSDLKLNIQRMLWDPVLAAVEHHSDRQTPTLDWLTIEMDSPGKAKMAFGLTAIMRDLDKKAGFKDAAKYTKDESFKRRQIEANWPRDREREWQEIKKRYPENYQEELIAERPQWGEERGSIIPLSLLDSFEKLAPIERAKCQSYEAYMLQNLGWMFDVIHPEIRDMIIAEGGPGIVLDYLGAHLPTSEFARVLRALTSAELYL